MMIPDYRVLVGALTSAEVDFVIVGGVALVLHGSARVTRDLDICYSRQRDALKRLAAALAPYRPTLRGATDTLPFKLDPQTLQSGLNFTLSTTAGDIDLLGEMSGIGQYPVVTRFAQEMELYGVPVKVLSLEGLERAKRAAGRLKDIHDLNDILEMRRQTGQ
jgi:nucleotidyltransferase AbiEii toxin of type IV toxin-antitoxin system